MQCTILLSFDDLEDLWESFVFFRLTKSTNIKSLQMNFVS